MIFMLETPRLILKPILGNELHSLYTLLTNDYVRRYLCDDEVLSMSQVADIVAQSRKHFEAERFGLWLIEKKQDSEEIGFVGLLFFFDEKQPQLAYALLPTATKQGYATEAANRIVQYCFEELRYEYLVASCDRANLESQKVAERIGMKKVEEKIMNGNDLVFFRIENSSSISSVQRM